MLYKREYAICSDSQKALNMEIIQTDGYYNVFPYSIQEVTYNYLGTQTLPKENNKK